MARVKFNGPAGSKFEGIDLLLAGPGKGKIGDLAALQRETGLKMPELREQMEGSEYLSMQVTLYLTLRNAGLFVTFAEAGRFAEADIDIVAEPGDLPDDAGGEPDPTSAPTASGRGGDVPATTHAATSPARPKKKSRGSSSRSTPAS